MSAIYDPIPAQDSLKDLLLKEKAEGSYSILDLTSRIKSVDIPEAAEINTKRIRITDTSGLLFIEKPHLDYKKILGYIVKTNSTVHSISPNARRGDITTPSLDLVISKAQKPETVPSQLHIHSLLQNGRARLLGAPTINVLLLTTESETHSFRSRLEDTQIDNARRWIRQLGLEIQDEHQISTYSIGANSSVESLAFVIGMH